MRAEAEPKLFVVRGTPEPADDAALALAAGRGSPHAAGAIWDRHAGLVRGILRRSLGADDVEDHVQEVFLRLFKQLPELRKPESLRSFLIGIAIRVAGTELRRRRVRRWLHIAPPDELENDPAPVRDDDAREAVSRLYAILDRLDADSRVLFVLRYVEALELTEVAAARGVSLATVKRKLARTAERVFALARRDEILLTYLSNDMRLTKGDLA
jgi:RNA polymerase sigma-70 factor (ECF subfamily)